MNFYIISFILSTGLSPANSLLLEVPLEAKNFAVLKTNYFKPIALMENSIIVEGEAAGIEQLQANRINFKILLDKSSFENAKKHLSLYIVIPPFWKKSDDAKDLLAKNGKILTEDSYSYLYLTRQDFAESLPSWQYEINHVSRKKIVLPETVKKSALPKISLLLPDRNPVIDSIIAKITPTEVAQSIRELSGEVPVTISGQSDTILTRYALAPKNSSAIRYCYEKLLTYSGLDSVKFHSFTWPTNRTDSNVIATKLGRVYPNQYWIIGGHIDCTSEATYRMTYAPGADDNATGTIAMMITAKYLASIPFKYTIRFLAWNAEEFGLYGSAAHAQEALNRNDSIMGVLNGDMIASETTDLDSVRIYTGTRAGSVAIGDTFFKVNADYGIGLGVRRTTSMIANSDHYSYYSRGYNAVCVIENDFCPYYHTIQDRITASSFDTVFYAKVVKALVATLATLAEPDTSLRDVGVTVITAPTGIIDSAQIITPACSVYNYGNTAENYSVRMKIGTLYNNTASVSGHSPGTYQYVTFPNWTANELGLLVVSCSTELNGDVNNPNDNKTDSVTVILPQYYITGYSKYYWTPYRAVLNTQLNLTGGQTRSTLTDFNGYYIFSDVLGGLNYTITPEKINTVRDPAVSSFDAAYILQYIVGSRTLTSQQLVAADASGNSQVTSYDAALVLRYMVGQIQHFPAGDWKFQPVSRSYNPLNSNQTNQDYTAILIGDVSGNWQPSEQLPVTSFKLPGTCQNSIWGGNLPIDENTEFRIPNIEKSIRDKRFSSITETIKNTEFSMYPIKVSNTNDVISADIILSYNPDEIEIKDVFLGNSTSDYLYTWTIFGKTVRIALASARAINGDVELLKLAYVLKGVRKFGSQDTRFKIQSLILNERESIVTKPSEDGMTGNQNELPIRFYLALPKPNPFGKVTRINYDLPKTSDIQIGVFDASGKMVKTLVETSQPAGRFSLVWDGKDEQGKQSANGIYFIRMKADTHKFLRKVILLKQ